MIFMFLPNEHYLESLLTPEKQAEFENFVS